MKPQVAKEHEFEAQYGLPEALPAGERILWQGAPGWRTLARQVFHVNKVALYFAAMLAWRVVSVLSGGEGLAAALASITWLAPLFALALGALLLLARWTATTTAYTLTNKRVVMRIGIVLTVTYNLPLSRIESADRHGGDIALTLERGTRIAWLQLWPHARPWRVANPQPTLRALGDAPAVCALLVKAWSEVNDVAAKPRSQPQPRPPAQPQPAATAVRATLVAHNG